MTIDLVHDHDHLSIGDMSSVTGLPIHTLRYYEKVGLIAPVPRLSSGHRRYSRETVQRAEALGYLRATGLGLAEMRRYLRSVDEGDEAAAEISDLLQAHVQVITEQIRKLEVRRDYIQAKAAYWQAVADGEGDSAPAQLNLQRARDLSGDLS